MEYNFKALLSVTASILMFGCNEASYEIDSEPPVFEGRVGSTSDVGVTDRPTISRMTSAIRANSRDDSNNHWFETHKFKVQDEPYRVHIWSEMLGDTVDTVTTDILNDEFNFTVKGDSFMPIYAIDYWNEFDSDSNGPYDPAMLAYTVLAYYEQHSQDLVDSGQDVFIAEIFNQSVGLVTWQQTEQLSKYGNLTKIILKQEDCDGGIEFNAAAVMSEDFEGDDEVDGSGYRYMHNAAPISMTAQDWESLEGLNCELSIGYEVTLDYGKDRILTGETKLLDDFNPRRWINVTFDYNPDGIGSGVISITHDVANDWDDARHDQDIDVVPPIGVPGVPGAPGDSGTPANPDDWEDVELPNGGVFEGKALHHVTKVLGYGREQAIELASVVGDRGTSNVKLVEFTNSKDEPKIEAILTIEGHTLNHTATSNTGYQTLKTAMKNEVYFSFDLGFTVIGIRTVAQYPYYDSGAGAFYFKSLRNNYNCGDISNLAFASGSYDTEVIPTWLIFQEAICYGESARSNGLAFEFTDSQLENPELIREFMWQLAVDTKAEAIVVLDDFGQLISNVRRATYQRDSDFVDDVWFNLPQTTFDDANTKPSSALSDDFFKITQSGDHISTVANHK
ncbi:hypothetical protein [Vibrio astriarenae]|uniref:hypothetical protein n=1 Tax=Vibrio astriarenae TaxID=1481923 RepID=UPI003735F19E